MNCNWKEAFKNGKTTFTSELFKLNGESRNASITVAIANMEGKKMSFLQRLIAIDTLDIAYFFADGRLSYFTTCDKHKYIVDYTLEELENMLDPQHYFRVSRAYIIHSKAVKEIHNYFNGKLKLELKPAAENSSVVISRERAGAFKEWMGK
ncbi:MAG: LytTR family transcriptional regulator [Bacteroidota bacterium]|nr:LytTR family transcriptional regulator [Bacteroidota bacterium]